MAPNSEFFDPDNASDPNEIPSDPALEECGDDDDDDYADSEVSDNFVAESTPDAPRFAVQRFIERLVENNFETTYITLTDMCALIHAIRWFRSSAFPLWFTVIKYSEILMFDIDDITNGPTTIVGDLPASSLLARLVQYVRASGLTKLAPDTTEGLQRDEFPQGLHHATTILFELIRCNGILDILDPDDRAFCTELAENVAGELYAIVDTV